MTRSLNNGRRLAQMDSAVDLVDPAYLALVFDHMPNAALAIDVTTFEPIVFNRQMCDLVGYGSEELSEIGLQVLADNGTYDREYLHRTFLARINEGPHTWRSRLNRKDGTLVAVEVALGVRHSRDGSVYAIVILTDLTDLLEIQEELSEKERLLSEAQSLAGVGSWNWDARTGVHSWSTELERLVGQRAESVAASREGILSLIHPEDRAAFRCALEDGTDQVGSPKGHEWRMVLPDGSVRYVEGRSTVLRDSLGEPIRAFGTIQDVTERHRLAQERDRFRREIAATERFDAVGRLARGIAHDFNNVLGAIVNFAALGQLMAAESPVSASSFDGILAAAARAQKLIDNLTVNRRVNEQKTSISVGQTVMRMMPVLKAGLTSKVQIDLEIEDGDDFVVVSISDLERIIFNLAANAADAMPDGGLLRIVVKSSGVTSHHRRSGLAAESRGQVTLTMEDTGQGIPHEIRDRIFEPYFSTRSEGSQGGTGLGLYVVARIVEDSGGDIAFDSVVNRGTRFRISLPSANASDFAKSDSLEFVRSNSNETILLVDDDDTFRLSGQELLEVLGFQVLTAENAQVAERILQSNPAIQVVVTDLTMPIVSGLELARRVQSTRPDVAIFLSTGLAAASLREEIDRMGLAGVLQKPWNPMDLGALAAASRRAADSKLLVSVQR